MLLDFLALVTEFPDYSEYNESYVFLAVFRYGEYLLVCGCPISCSTSNEGFAFRELTFSPLDII